MGMIFKDRDTALEVLPFAFDFAEILFYMLAYISQRILGISKEPEIPSLALLMPYIICHQPPRE
jgi:hypothetical protein